MDIELDITSFSSELPKVISPHLANLRAEGYECIHCHLVFLHEKDLNTHRSAAERLISCSMCSIKFLTVKGMKQHFGKKHEKSRPYRCGICFKRFRNVYASRIHKQQVHMHSSRQSCSYCGKSVYNKYSLSRHFKICTRKAMELEVCFEQN